LIALGSLTPNARDILRSFKRRKYKITIAELFDIRLSAAARGGNLSPFVGTISELLKGSAAAQASSDNGNCAITDDVDELSGIVTTEATAPLLEREISDAEIPF
jgi:hypothetical protein